MFTMDHLRDDDVAQLLRLVGEVSEIPSDKLARRKHVLSGLLKMVGGRSAIGFEMARADEGPLARAGSIVNIDYSCEAEARGSECYLVHNNPADPNLDEFIAARGETVTMVRKVDDDAWYRCDHYDIVRRPFDMDSTLYCRLPLPDGSDFGVGIQRCPGDAPFSDRDKAVVHLLHTHAPHVYYAPASRNSELDALAPRLKPVLRYLLQGDAEKEVAFKLKLSPHTVHRYVQAIYKELDVHSRAELLAKYARQM